MASKVVRNERGGDTREAILLAAERLFAEHGVVTVSNRQVSEAAGQGNNAAVGYHFGTKMDLVRAIVAKHAVSIDRRRSELVRLHDGSTDVRSWVSCMVLPVTDHLAALGSPTWYARFGAQVTTDPELRPVLMDEASASESLQTAITQLAASTPDLSDGTRAARNSMARILVTHGCAEFERYLAQEQSGSKATWERCGADLVDAMVGVWTAPATT